MNVIITESTYQSILAQAQKDAPVESCGYLLGTDKETATENYPMTNVDHSEEHFSFDPKEQFAAVKELREQGLVLLGNWHSHPASPSRPSEEDKRLAFDTQASYFILSLNGGEPVLNSFQVSRDKVVTKEDLRIR